jgi:RNA polymerase-binding transcription factor DksA
VLVSSRPNKGNPAQGKDFVCVFKGGLADFRPSEAAESLPGQQTRMPTGASNHREEELMRYEHMNEFSEFRTLLLSLRDGLDKSLRRPQRAVLAQVEAALLRIERGTYGICNHCFLVIPKAELLRQPHTERCGHCRYRQAQVAA